MTCAPVLFGLVSLLARNPAAGFAVSICALTVCAVFAFPALGKIPSHVWAPVGGALLVLLLPHFSVPLFKLQLPELTLHAVAQELAGHWGVPALILAFAYLAISLDESGFFDWCSLELMRLGGGSGPRLLLVLFLGVSILTFFTSNDIVVLAVTPILIHLGRNARIRNMTPFLLAEFVAANTASMGLYIGNPTNIVIGDAVGLGFVDYAREMWLPTVVATFTALGIVLLVFVCMSRRNRVVVDYVVPAPQVSWNRQMSIKVGLFAACLMLLSVLGNPGLIERLMPKSDPSFERRVAFWSIIAVGGLFALIAFVYDASRDLRARDNALAHQRSRLGRLPFEIVPFFLSFCLLLRSLQEAGLVKAAADRVVDAFRSGPLIGSLATGFYGVGLVNVTNNIPATIFFEKAWLGAAHLPKAAGLGARLAVLDPRYPKIFVEAALFASNFGANLTFVGALAGLIWLRQLRNKSMTQSDVRTPTPREFIGYGLVIVPIVTALTCAAVAWQCAG